MAIHGLRESSQFDPHENLNRLKAGSILVARDNLDDPNFKSAIILICQHNDESSYGLVLNRPSHMPLSEVFDQVPDGQDKRTIYIGGPVQPEELQILQISSKPVEGSYPVSEGVYLGGHWNELQDILLQDCKSVRLFLGYSGWGEEQLAKEIVLGVWEVLNVNLVKFLLGPEEAWMGGIAELKNYLNYLSRL